MGEDKRSRSEKRGDKDLRVKDKAAPPSGDAAPEEPPAESGSSSSSSSGAIFG